MRGQFYTTHQISGRQSMTPEGFLLCEGVPVARTGSMQYSPREVPVSPGPDGLITITRDEGEVFRPEFLASLNGKPVVDTHPREKVQPRNWRDLTHGIMLNPRRGDGEANDCIVADLLVTTEHGIQSVRSGKREVSLGYEADYEELAHGVGRQLNMICNHVALVDEGRCGPRCAIGDQQENDMRARFNDERPGLIERLRAALKRGGSVADAQAVLDDAEAEEAAKKKEKEDVGDTHIHVGDTGALGERVSALESGLTRVLDGLNSLKQAVADGARHPVVDEGEDDEEKKKKEREKAEDEKELEEETGATKDSVRATTDSALLADAFQIAVSGAEILVPGIRVPAYDRAKLARKTLDDIKALRRSALDLAYSTADGRALIEELNGNRVFSVGSTSASQQRSMFLAAVAAKRTRTNATHDRGIPRATQAGMPVAGSKVRSIADLNKLNAEKYKGMA